MNVKVTSDDKFIRHGNSERKKRIEIFENMENGLKRWMIKEGRRC